MRWLLIAFLVSLVALLFAAGGVAYHIWRQRSRHGDESSTAFESAEDPELRAKL